MLLWIPFLAACLPLPNYPSLEREKQVQDYHGVAVEDPYRFLEDAQNPKTVKWAQEENELATTYLASIPCRKEIHERMEEMSDYVKYSTPFKAGRRLLFFVHEGVTGQPILYVQDGLNAEPRILIDPNLLADSSIGDVAPSWDGQYLAYSVASKGSDWKEIKVIEIKTGKELKETLKGVKFPSIAWEGKGFYYTGYKEEQSVDTHATLYYHKLGSPQEKDTLIYADEAHPYDLYAARTTEEGALFLSVMRKGKQGNSILWKANKEGWLPVVNDFDHLNEVIDVFDQQCYLLQDNEIFICDMQKGTKVPFPLHVEGIIQSVAYVGGKFFVTTLHDAYSKAFVFDFEGKSKAEIALPPYGTVTPFQGMRKDKYTFYLFSSFTEAPTIYRYLIEKGKSELFKEVHPKINLAEYETKQLFSTSLDGTKVPLFVIHKKDLEKDRLRPTLLTGYGGFDISYTPSFTPALFALLERGGIVAISNIRGGGEYGKPWHEGGSLTHKQNSFDDFISAAELLISLGYTSPPHLGITGGSNGGLLVSAVMIKRPDLFGAVIARKGVLDMLRFQYFTIGWAWTSEYGNSENPDDFKILYAYSPLHNLKMGVNYPPTLLTTADHDDRVVPCHSYKFAATLQAVGDKQNPYLLRIYPNSGHGAGAPRELYLNEMADLVSFFLCTTERLPISRHKLTP